MVGAGHRSATRELVRAIEQIVPDRFLIQVDSADELVPVGHPALAGKPMENGQFSTVYSCQRNARSGPVTSALWRLSQALTLPQQRSQAA